VLTDKRLIITGVVRPDSPAWAVAARAQRAGAHVLLTAGPQQRALTTAAAAELPRPVAVLDVDLTRDDDLHRLTDHVLAGWGGLDGALHAVGPGSPGAEGAATTFRTTGAAHRGLARVVRELAPHDGGALVGLDGGRGCPADSWTPACRAALDVVNGEIARAPGPRRLRTNLVVPELVVPWATTTAPDDAAVADTACFLLSDLARAITGQVVRVDGGYRSGAAARHDPEGQVTAEPDDRRRLTRAFADLREHGISAHTGLRGEVDQLRTGLHADLVRRFPAGSAAFAFTTDSDERSFSPTGALRAPLTVHVSDAALRTLVGHRLTEVGLVVEGWVVDGLGGDGWVVAEARDQTTLTLTPS
jgi:enoyl ACP reductase